MPRILDASTITTLVVLPPRRPFALLIRPDDHPRGSAHNRPTPFQPPVQSQAPTPAPAQKTIAVRHQPPCKRCAAGYPRNTTPDNLWAPPTKGQHRSTDPRNRASSNPAALSRRSPATANLHAGAALRPTRGVLPRTTCGHRRHRRSRPNRGRRYHRRRRRPSWCCRRKWFRRRTCRWRRDLRSNRRPCHRSSNLPTYHRPSNLP